METIVAAALRVPLARKWQEHEFRGRKVYPEHLTISAPPPARHANLLHPFVEDFGAHPSPQDQGFITSTGRFVEREEALRIAVESGQPMIDHPARNSTMLFSEDLW